MRRAAYKGILCLGLLAWGIVPAAAQMETREGIALQNQILELQREIQVLSQRGAGGGAPAYVAPYPQAAPPGASSDIVTQLLTRVDALESAMRDLRGQVEQLSNQVQQQSAQLGKRIDDLQFKVQNPQAGSSAPTPGPPPAASASGPPPAPPPVSASPGPPLSSSGPRTPELSLRHGDAALARHDYTTAEQDARAVLANRASPRAYDAQYLLAEALMGQRQYSQAAIAFDDAYNRQKKGPHAPDALLGLADSLIAINEKRAACDTLTKLRVEFPSARADLRDRAAQMGKRAACR
ncbi:MAG: tetratricopeptide repeat protein [Acetobacteraceae bacterium]